MKEERQRESKLPNAIGTNQEFKPVPSFTRISLTRGRSSLCSLDSGCSLLRPSSYLSALRVNVR